MEILAMTLALIAIGIGAGWISYRLRMRQLLAGLEKDLRRDLAERDELRKDAQRYRWLRDNPWPAELALTIALQRNARLDSDIDAAMHTSPTRVDSSERLVE